MAFTINFEIFAWSCQFKDLSELVRTDYFVRLAYPPARRNILNAFQVNTIVKKSCKFS
jgi:hypothetical protein